MNTIELGAGAQVTLLVRAEQTGGQCAVVLGVAQPGLTGPPLHRHPNFTEPYILPALRALTGG